MVKKHPQQHARSTYRRPSTKSQTNFAKALWTDIKKTAHTLYRWVQNLRPTQIVFAHDLAMMALASLASLMLINPEHFSLIGVWFFLRYTTVYTLVTIAVFVWMRPNQHAWRYFSAIDVMRIILSVFYVNSLFFVLQIKLLELPGSATRVSLVTFLLSFTFLVVPRFVVYMFHTNWFSRAFLPARKNALRALIIGATDVAESYLRQLSKNHKHTFTIVGIIDDNRFRESQALHGVDIIGTLSELPAILGNFQRQNKPISTLLIANEDLLGAAIRPLRTLQETHEVELLRLSPANEMTRPLQENADPTAISCDEFRTDVNLPTNLKPLHDHLANKNILIVGANHMLIPHVCERFSHMNIARLSVINFARSEHPDLDLTFSLTPENIQTKMYVDDLSSKTNLTNILATEKPDIVILAPEFGSQKAVGTNPAQSFNLSITPMMLALDVLANTPNTSTFLLSSSHACNSETSLGAQQYFLEHIYLSHNPDNGLIARLPQILEDPQNIPNRALKQALSHAPILLEHPKRKCFFQSKNNATLFILNAIQAHVTESRALIITPDLNTPVNVCDKLAEVLTKMNVQKDYEKHIRFSQTGSAKNLDETFIHVGEQALTSKHQGLRALKPTPESTTNSSKLRARLPILVKNARASNDFEVEKTIRKLIGTH